MPMTQAADPTAPSSPTQIARELFRLARSPLDAIVQSWGLPTSIDSLAQAATAASIISIACKKLSLLRRASPPHEMADESKRVDIDPAQEAMRKEMLGILQCLAAECLAWRLLHFFDAHPLARGFCYIVGTDRDGPKRFDIEILSVNAMDGTEFSASEPPEAKHRLWAGPLRDLLEGITETEALMGRSRMVRRPPPQSLADRSIESLMADIRPNLDPAAVACLDAATLADAVPAATAFPPSVSNRGPRM